MSLTHLELQKGGLVHNPLPPPTASVLLSKAELKTAWVGVRRPEGGEKVELGARGQQRDNSKWEA